MTTPKFWIAPILLMSAGCFSPKVPASEETDGGTASGTEAPGSTGGTESTSLEDTGTGEETTRADETGTRGTETGAETDGKESAPTIETFLINGDSSSVEVDQASDVVLVATVVDADGNLEAVEFSRDGESLGPTTVDGDEFSVSFVVSGVEMNEDSQLEVRASDEAGNFTTATIDLAVDMPNGGLVEGWNFDNGESSAVYAIHPTDAGDVLWTGQVVQGGDLAMRVDRAEGSVWQETASLGRDFATGILDRDDGSFVVAAAVGSGFDLQTELRVYSAGGVATADQAYDGSPNNTSNWPLGLERDQAGDYFMLGSYIGAEAFSSFLLKTDSALNEEWVRDVTGSAATNGSPFVYDFDVRGDGMIALSGSRVVGNGNKLWIGIYDTGGGLEDQTTLSTEFDDSIGYDVAWTTDGLVVAGATNDGDGWARFARAYNDSLVSQWTVDGPANTDFSLAVTEDSFGRVVVASTETCSFNAATAAFDDCRLVLRSYDSEGTLRWQHIAEGGDPEFVGPLLARPGFNADIETDRLGYVYVSAQHQLPVGGNEERSEWWSERHHP